MSNEIKSVHVWTKNGFIFAVTFPGEGLPPGDLGTHEGEHPIEDVPGVGEAWPVVKPEVTKTPKATPKKPAAKAA